jgi:UDP-N-acetylmuramate dehydrogenase
MQVLRNVDMSSMNTLGLPCEAEVLYRVKTSNDLLNSRLEIRNQHSLVLGGGSNLVLPAKLKRPVIKMEMTGIEIANENDNRCLIEVAAGENWHDFVQWSVNNGLWGIENLALIPGTVGAAPIQNIGAYGVEIVDVLDWVEFFHIKTAETIRLTPNECKFSYRNSIFKNELKDLAVVTRMGLRLSRKSNPQLSYGPLQEFKQRAPKVINSKQIAKEVCRIRLSKLPDPKILGNAGSFFKNPVVSDKHYQLLLQLFPELVAYSVGENWKLAAGWLIERIGFKGIVREHVGVHDKQALVLVNHGGGTSEELLKLVKDIEQKIYSTFKIRLEREVRVILE